MAGVRSYLVELMSLSDLDHVMAIEQASFAAPWSARAYRFEITENANGTMLVIRYSPGPWSRLASTLSRLGFARPHPVLGYAGCWHLVDEIHVSTIAVHPDWRGKGLAGLLLLSLLDRGVQLGARRATLEVRVSNGAAQGLYEKYGFKTVSRQKRYYVDNNEDAYIMATPVFDDLSFLENLRRRRRELQKRVDSRVIFSRHTAP